MGLLSRMVEGVSHFSRKCGEPHNDKIPEVRRSVVMLRRLRVDLFLALMGSYLRVSTGVCGKCFPYDLVILF